LTTSACRERLQYRLYFIPRYPAQGQLRQYFQELPPSLRLDSF
jgi:hypothetical protein